MTLFDIGDIVYDNRSSKKSIGIVTGFSEVTDSSNITVYIVLSVIGYANGFDAPVHVDWHPDNIGKLDAWR